MFSDFLRNLVDRLFGSSLSLEAARRKFDRSSATSNGGRCPKCGALMTEHLSGAVRIHAKPEPGRRQPGHYALRCENCAGNPPITFGEKPHVPTLSNPEPGKYAKW